MSLTTMTFSAERALGETVVGPALVNPYPFSARYDLDRATGTISRVAHPLRGTRVQGTVLICPGVQGGVAAGWALLAMQRQGCGFLAMVFGKVNPVMVQGAHAAGIPIMSGVDEAIFEHVTTGMLIRVDPSNREVSVVAAEPDAA